MYSSMTSGTASTSSPPWCFLIKTIGCSLITRSQSVRASLTEVCHKVALTIADVDAARKHGGTRLKPESDISSSSSMSWWISRSDLRFGSSWCPVSPSASSSDSSSRRSTTTGCCRILLVFSFDHQRPQKNPGRISFPVSAFKRRRRRGAGAGPQSLTRLAHHLSQCLLPRASPSPLHLWPLVYQTAGLTPDTSVSGCASASDGACSFSTTAQATSFAARFPWASMSCCGLGIASLR